MEYERSGLKREEFCALHGLSVASLYSYRRRQRGLEPQQSVGSSVMRPAACDRDRNVSPQDKKTDALFLKPARKNK
jgi:hypothetical protein